MRFYFNKSFLIIFILILFISCSKSEKAVKDESITFSTNLETETYNVKDTLPLVVTLTSKIPSGGVRYLVTTTFTETSQQIYKLDTTINQSTLKVNIPNLKTEGTYSVSVTATSKSNSTNSLTKLFSVSNNPLARFSGYKVNLSEKTKNEINYWRDCGVMWDVIVNKFNVLPNGQNNSNFISQVISGDFNKDGYIDFFNSGTGSYSGKPVDYCQWLIWNQTKKTFENVSLFNDKNLKYFGGNQRRSVSYDMNKDGYTDVVIFDSGDDGLNYTGPRPLQPIRIVLSDGNGGYDLKDLNNITPNYMYNHSGDVGDLNNDGFPDLVSATGSIVYISWGISSFPYFSSKVSYFDIFKTADNGFGEDFPEGAGYNIVTLADVNKDGFLDIVGGTSEQLKIHEPVLPFDMRNKILINQGGGKFNKKGLIYLPFYFDDIPFMKNNKWTNHDFRVIDVNNDGLNDIIASGSVEYDNFNYIVYFQNSNGTFTLDKNRFIFNINANKRVAGRIPGFWKPWLMIFDFDGDGQKDVSYIDNHNFEGELKTKSVFIRTGDQFIEKDFYQFDPYIKSIKH